LVEILRLSPVNTTGVPTPDLIGWPQDDTMRMAAIQFRFV
jgi:hypothetical protein